MINYSKQKGMNLLVLSIGLGALMFVAMILIKTVPHYLDFYQISKIVNKVLDQQDLDLKTPSELDSNVRQRLSLNNIYVLDGKDRAEKMKFKKEGGFMRAYIDYVVEAPLPTPVMQNSSDIKLVMHFKKMYERNMNE